MVATGHHESREPLLRVEGLTTELHSESGTLVAVDHANMTIHRGEAVALVGESGCGKTMTALSIMRLIPTGRITSGKIFLRDLELVSLDDEAMRAVRGSEIAMVFQDPTTFLNPLMRVGEQIAEAISRHQKLSGAALHSRVVEALRVARLPDPESIARYYPHQLSGGMRQRVMIAMAISCRPSLLIADEPTTALDVTIQRQILDLITSIVQDLDMSLLLITHDLSLVGQACDRVYVMYAGQIVEEAPVTTFFRNTGHPYSQGLLSSIPKIDQRVERFTTIPGSVPSLVHPPSGCRFHPRCPYVMAKCTQAAPLAFQLEAEHRVHCWLRDTEVGIDECLSR